MAIIRTAQFGHGTMDMEFLGLSMERQPQILQELILSRWAHLPLTSLFSGIYGESPAEELLPSNMVRWKVLGIPFKPVYIISTTGTPRVGQEFEITASDSSLYTGAKVRLEDGKTLVYIKGQKTANAHSCTYIAQPVGNNEDDVIDSTLLEKGKALNYVAANYEEGSETGHPITWGTGDHYVNALTTIRHKFQITGDAMTEALCMEMRKPDKSQPGGEKVFRGYLPNVITDSGQSLLDFHAEAVERDLTFGKSNFDVSTGAVFNTTTSGKPVLMGDGLLRQFDSSYTVLYYPTDQISAVRGAIDRALAYLAYNTGQDTIDFYFIGGAGAKYIWNLAMLDFLDKSGQRVILNVDKSPVTVAGLDVETYKTSFGSIKLIMSKAEFDAKWSGKYKNARNLTSGVVNKTRGLHEAIGSVEPIVLDVLHKRMAPSKALAWAAQQGFKVVKFIKATNVTEEKLLS
jgi:hypothetical protein